MSAPRLPSLAETEEYLAELQAELREGGPDHPDYGMLRYQIGMCLSARFALAGTDTDLNEAISHLEAAVAAIPLTHPDHAGVLLSLAGAFTDRYVLSGHLADERAAIMAARAAIDVASAAGQACAEILPLAHGSLGTTYQARYLRTSAVDDLNEAISRYQVALDVAGPSGEGRELILGNLAGALRTRFELTGDTADLDAAIESGQAAVAMTPRGHVYHAEYLSNLGVSLMRRFQRRGALRDADDAVTALRGSLAAMAPGSPNYAVVHSNLAFALLSRFGRTGADADLDGAIAASRATEQTGYRAEPRFAGMAQSAATALLRRYERNGQPTDLDAAVDMARRGVAANGPDSENSIGPLTLLTGLLRTRFQRSADPADLDGAIRTAYQAIAITPAGHIWRANALLNLALTLQSRFELTGLPTDRDAALASAVQAGEAAATWSSVRFRARALTGTIAGDDPVLAARALADAVLLLPEIVPRHLARGDRQHLIGSFGGIAGAAASAALADPSVPEAERPARALALLEASRAVLLSQALDTRDDLTDLRGRHSDLAARFTGLRERLDQSDPGQPGTGQPGTGEFQPDETLAALGTQAAGRERLEREFAKALAEIRALDGFAHFGLPPSFEELLAEAASGPVVTLTVSARGGGALLLTRDGISYLNLPGLADDAVTRQVNAFRAALEEADSDDEEAAAEARRTLTGTLEWLWDAAAGPVLDALGYRARPADDQPWPRVWWVPGGKLGLLPVHAAGYHKRRCAPGEPAASVLDAVVSSYTPTVRALRYARQQARNPGGARRALIVAMPVTQGQQDLPGAGAEARMASAVLPDPIVLAEPEDHSQRELPGDLPTRENVLRYLPAAAIAHFACHADSDATDPSRSLLVLHDYETAPLTVATLAPVDHERLELTYLSACSTAFTAVTDLADEAIHLTSAFLLAGSRHVVGTLWTASDPIALRVATAFYRGLSAAGGEVDTARAAVALHNAVRAMRDLRREDPSIWAPYLHAGA